MPHQVIDLAIFNEIRDLMEDSMTEFVATYLANSPRLIRNVEQALAQGDAEDVYHNAHQLKGGSGSIGATRLAEIAMGIEIIGKAGSTEGVASLLAELKTEFQQVEQALNKLM